MPESHDMELKVFVDLAKNSSGEIGALGNGVLINYETGKSVQFVDEETAMFLASAREIVLEMARRIQVLDRNQ